MVTVVFKGKTKPKTSQKKHEINYNRLFLSKPTPFSFHLVTFISFSPNTHPKRSLYGGRKYIYYILNFNNIFQKILLFQ